MSLPPVNPNEVLAALLPAIGCPECAWGKVAGCWRCGSRVEHIPGDTRPGFYLDTLEPVSNEVSAELRARWIAADTAMRASWAARGITHEEYEEWASGDDAQEVAA